MIYKNSPKIVFIFLLFNSYFFLNSMEENKQSNFKINEYLCTPWRAKYSQQPQIPNVKLKNDCPFCDQISKEEDEKYMIIRTGKFIFMINANAYAQEGSLMIIPNEHIAEIKSLDKNLKLELTRLIQLLSLNLDNLGYKNFSLGLNRGKDAAASIPDHLHFHVVPYRNPKKSNKFSDLAKALSFFDQENVIPESKILYKEIKEIIKLEYKKTKTNIDNEEKHNCPFCHIIKNHENDKENLVITRLKNSLLMLNKNPIVQGQMIIIPFQHASNLHVLREEIVNEILELFAKLEQISPKILKNTAYNMAVNIGKQPNGRPDDHISFDFWPRWPADLSQILLSGIQIISIDIPRVIEGFKKELEDKNIN